MPSLRSLRSKIAAFKNVQMYSFPNISRRRRFVFRWSQPQRNMASRMAAMGRATRNAEQLIKKVTLY